MGSSVSYLNEYRYDIEAPDDGPVMGLPGEYVQGTDCALNDLLHAHAVSVGTSSTATAGYWAALLHTHKHHDCVKYTSIQKT